jgi:hypothetical protein
LDWSGVDDLIGGVGGGLLDVGGWLLNVGRLLDVGSSWLNISSSGSGWLSVGNSSSWLDIVSSALVIESNSWYLIRGGGVCGSISTCTVDSSCCSC